MSAQRPRGENGGQKDRPAAFIDDAQPADALAVAQADALGGIGLPNRVGLRGTTAAMLGGRSPPAGGAAQAGRAKPALQRAPGRHGAPAVAPAQEDADEAGAPGGVLAAEFKRRAAHGRVGGVRGHSGTAVGGGQRVVTVGAEAAQQAAGGAEFEAEGMRDGGSGLALAVALPEGATEGGGNGGGHGRAPDGENRMSPVSLAGARARPNRMSHLAAKHGVA
jgi:hypothetical protein